MNLSKRLSLLEATAFKPQSSERLHAWVTEWQAFCDETFWPDIKDSPATTLGCCLGLERPQQLHEVIASQFDGAKILEIAKRDYGADWRARMMALITPKLDRIEAVHGDDGLSKLLNIVPMRDLWIDVFRENEGEA